MTELFIDGVPVVLPKDFSVTVKRENPLFTKNGEYTYDITLQLSNPTNAKLYGHLNRLNSVTQIRTERPAILRADNRLYCNGTEVITGWTDDTVSIQIASGNSELNYLIGAELAISELEGMPDTGIENHPEDYIVKTYPEVDYCLAPVHDSAAGETCNFWGLYHNQADPFLHTFLGSPRYAQPYLFAYLREVMKALGYTLSLGQLEGTPWKHLYICQVAHTSQWNKMLPGWTVLELLEQVEQLLNAVFVVDNRTKTVALYFRNQYYQGAKAVHVRQIEDEYELQIEEEPDTDDMADCNVSYKVEDSDFWRWAVLSEEVRKKAKRDTIPADYAPERGTRLTAWFTDPAHKKTDTIYTDALDGRQYLYLREYAEYNNPTYAMVDSFAELDRGDTAPKVELEMVPVAFAKIDVRLTDSGTTDADDAIIPISIPTVTTGQEEEKEYASLEEMITQNASEPSEQKQNICLAFYDGLHGLNFSYNGIAYVYPLSYIDEYVTDYVGRTEWSYRRINDTGASLRPVALDSLLYSGAYDIDRHKEVKVLCHDPNLYNPGQIFEIRNKRYVCREMEFTLDAHGRKGAWTGTFHPIRISDTEADLRWILADGKWRDGGVWLDNGRWLDS